MKALLFSFGIPQFLLLQALRPLSSRFCYQGWLSTVKLVELPEPTLPSAQWIKIKTKYCGFCGSDLSLVTLDLSPASSPFCSSPSVLGHEFCGEVTEIGSEVKNCRVGDLVTIAPLLNCSVREITPACRTCQQGNPSCENFAEGRLAPGMLQGVCREIPGGFAEYTVAHYSQVFRVPEGVSAESAALVEPLAVALQAVLDNQPKERDQVLVIGAGVIGSLVIKAIRALRINCPITVAAHSRYQADFASKCGANQVVLNELIDESARITGSRAYQPVMGRKILSSGFDRIFDTVGHNETMEIALRIAAPGSTISLIGIGKELKIDPTPLWLKMLMVKGSLCYGYHTFQNRRQHVFEIALGWLSRKEIVVEDLLSHKFRLEDYPKMIEANLHKSQKQTMKTMVAFGQGGQTQT